MKTPRWSARVAEGLSSIAAYVECELQAHEASCLACSCDVCCYRIPDPVYEGQFIGLRDDMECLCEAKSYAAKCDGCRETIEWEAALAWIGGQQRRRRKP